MKHSAADEEALERASLYALGALSSEDALALEEHLAAGCEVCQKEIGSLASVSAALAFDIPAASPSPRPRERLVSFLRKGAGGGGPEVLPADRGGVFTSVTIRADEGDWQEFVKGVFVKRLFEDAERGTLTSLYRLLPGAVVPAHRHEGTEECLVLEGDARYGELVLRPGDYHCARKGSTHSELTSVSGTLLLIVAQASHKTPAV